MKLHDVEIDEAKLAEYCREQHIRQLIIFGSITRDSFRPDSDVDLAIEYEPDSHVSLLDFAGQELSLSALLGRTVHLTELSTIPERIRDHVLQNSIPAYVG